MHERATLAQEDPGVSPDDRCKINWITVVPFLFKTHHIVKITLRIAQIAHVEDRYRRG